MTANSGASSYSTSPSVVVGAGFHAVDRGGRAGDICPIVSALRPPRLLRLLVARESVRALGQLGSCCRRPAQALQAYLEAVRADPDTGGSC
jgi:hypothetical protein